MQKYMIQHRGMELAFEGRLLAQNDSKKYPDQAKWSIFQIFHTIDEKFVVNIITATATGEDTNRSFFCSDMAEVKETLRHPIYGGISFKAQNCYSYALRVAERHGIIDDAREWELTPEDTEVREARESMDNFDDFDFSEI